MSAANDPADVLRSRLADLESRISRVGPDEARRLTEEQGGRVLDVRDDHELAAGTVPGALHISRGFLELQVGQQVPRSDTPLVVMCAAGQRSLLAADTLQQMGYSQVCSMDGGFRAWKAGGYPVEQPEASVESLRQRYARHLAMPEVGEAGQRRLLQARVMVVGAGGLGSPVALYLAAAGVGHLGLVDADRVERSNLQRQILHTDAAIGHPKIASAAERIHALNPEVSLETFERRLDRHNALDTLRGYDIVVDGSDNFPTRYLLNDACVRLARPLVYGAVFRFQGQVAVFNPGDGQRPCYRCLFPTPPSAEEAPGCAEAGVFGLMPGIAGCFQAAEVVKWMLGLGESLEGRLLSIDALSGTTRTSRIARDPECRWCQASGPPEEFPDYEAFCRG